MNSKRRSELNRALGLLRSAHAIVETARDEEQYSYDNLPEQFQEGDRGDAMEEAISNLEDAIDAIESAEQSITEAM